MLAIHFLFLVIFNLKFSKCEESGRIINGTMATLGQFPFMVSLIERTAETCKVNCAGTLITELNILTAAKCFIKPGAVANNYAFAGDIDVGEVVDIPPSRQVRTIVRATTHPNAYRFTNPVNPEFDVAVLEVIAPFKLTQYANVAAVAPYELPNLSNCMGLGFGRIGKNVTAPSGKLHYGRLRIDRNICKCPWCYCIYSTEVEIPAVHKLSILH
ncbi:acrosin-like [Hermetia illucens]|uniref:acrosin-like n=1 Tax=Hermetia illucens TaxID=343691 RepID=UPI0018CBF891|nr:acrosin-like [Hermetia illucens]